MDLIDEHYLGHFLCCRTKPRGLPELGEQLDSVPGCGAPSSARLTPYRLPRLGGDPGGGEEEAVEEQVWSRHGYECHSAR